MKLVTFDEHLEEQLKDPGFKEAYDALAPTYELIVLRIRKGLSQKQLAKLAGVKKSTIRRFEDSDTEPELALLRKIAKALDAEVVITIKEKEE